jgi:hypothetical protein
MLVAKSQASLALYNATTYVHNAMVSTVSWALLGYTYDMNQPDLPPTNNHKNYYMFLGMCKVKVSRSVNVKSSIEYLPQPSNATTVQYP